MILEGIALFGCWGILRVKAHSQSGLAKLHSLRGGLQPCTLLSQLVGPQVLRLLAGEPIPKNPPWRVLWYWCARQDSNLEPPA